LCQRAKKKLSTKENSRNFSPSFKAHKTYLTKIKVQIVQAPLLKFETKLSLQTLIEKV